MGALAKLSSHRKKEGIYLMEKTLGRLERVDLRKIWETEDRDFTPWLARDEHLQILGSAIDIELEFEAQEKEVGLFRADILCKNTLDNSWVLIENQIEKTDHRHLGQLLTYAAGLDAVTIVWIASEFTEEHRSALDWLNKITDANFRFFGLEIELWQIDNSNPALKFNVISQPNNWRSTVSRAARKIEEELSPLQDLQLKYWSRLSEFLDRESQFKIRSPRPQGWCNFSLGKTNVNLIVSISSQPGKLAASLYLYNNMKEKYDNLYEQKDNIENLFGESLNWENNPNKQTAVIKLEIDADIDNEEDWLKQHEWFKDKIETFDRVFRPIVREF